MSINITLTSTRTEFDLTRSKLNGKKIGLVPTMGNLHEGHLSLVTASIEEMDSTIVTIFVNPKQFGPKEDFNQYPRTPREDIEKITSLVKSFPNTKHEIVIFSPASINDIYPPNFATTISISGITSALEGAIRPTHFDGVTTVVYRLFTIAKASVVYFGQKDYQQCLVVKKMVEDLELQITIKIMPIIRNEKGLALSSRNQYLNSEEHEKALTLPKTLNRIKKLIDDKKDFQIIIEQILREDPAWDYLEVLDANTLMKLSNKNESLNKIIVGAYKVGVTRLLDNILC